MPIEPTYTIHPGAPTIELTRAADLEIRPDAAFPLSHAPDGLMLAMHVRRSIDLRSLTLSGVRGDGPLKGKLEATLDEIDRIARAHATQKRIVRFGERAYYESASSVAQHFGATLLARMFGAVSPAVMPEDVSAARGGSEPSRFDNSVVLSMADLQARPSSTATRPAQTGARTSAPVTFGRDARMWIGLTRDTPNLAAAAGSSEAMVATARPLVFESLLGVRSARWHIRDRQKQLVHDGRLAERDAYVKALRAGDRVSWSVSRTDAVRLVAELARSVDRQWHSQRRVHADLKPGNTLLGKDGIYAFDALDVAEGAISAGMTEGWAAPEQALARPITAASDVYALAMIAVAAIKAVIFGEESSLVVPAVGSGRRRLKMILNPEVWLDAQVLPLADATRGAWRDLLVRCLAADPAQRPQRGFIFADYVDELLDKYELPGRVAVSSGPGQLQFFVNSGEPAWVMYDG
ncbi:MAG TPA: hypothetical protein VFP84_06680 [Kofleriaceae bacterium]|nr:hypothetical protein [Kofleriaceae bacterium]